MDKVWFILVKSILFLANFLYDYTQAWAHEISPDPYPRPRFEDIRPTPVEAAENVFKIRQHFSL